MFGPHLAHLWTCTSTCSLSPAFAALVAIHVVAILLDWPRRNLYQHMFLHELRVWFSFRFVHCVLHGLALPVRPFTVPSISAAGVVPIRPPLQCALKVCSALLQMVSILFSL